MRCFNTACAEESWGEVDGVCWGFWVVAEAVGRASWARMRVGREETGKGCSGGAMEVEDDEGFQLVFFLSLSTSICVMMRFPVLGREFIAVFGVLRTGMELARM